MSDEAEKFLTEEPWELTDPDDNDTLGIDGQPGQAWPRVTVVLVSHQRKMDNEDQALLGVIKSYEEQDYLGPNDLNLILDPLNGEDVSYTPDMLRAVGVSKADPGIVIFADDKDPLAPNHLTVIARNFMEAWPENIEIRDHDNEALWACTVGHYMREIYDKVMPS